MNRDELYRDGWLAGRMDAIEMHSEAERRGVEGKDFVMSVIERDMQVLW